MDGECTAGVRYTSTNVICPGGALYIRSEVKCTHMYKDQKVHVNHVTASGLTMPSLLKYMVLLMGLIHCNRCIPNPVTKGYEGVIITESYSTTEHKDPCRYWRIYL